MVAVGGKLGVVVRRWSLVEGRGETILEGFGKRKRKLSIYYGTWIYRQSILTHYNISISC